VRQSCAIVLGGFLSVLAGCGGVKVFRPELPDLDLSAGEPLDMPVTLYLSEELSNFIASYPKQSAGHRYELADALEKGSIRVGRAAFTDVEIRRAGEPAAAGPGRRPLLIPSVANFSESGPDFLSSRVTDRLVMQWVLQGDGRKVLWRGRIMAEGSSNWRGGSSDAAQRRLGEALKACFQGIHTKMIRSPELRRVAEQAGGDDAGA